MCHTVTKDSMLFSEYFITLVWPLLINGSLICYQKILATTTYSVFCYQPQVNKINKIYEHTITKEVFLFGKNIYNLWNFTLNTILCKPIVMFSRCHTIFIFVDSCKIGTLERKNLVISRLINFYCYFRPVI